MSHDSGGGSAEAPGPGTATGLPNRPLVDSDASRDEYRPPPRRLIGLRLPPQQTSEPPDPVPPNGHAQTHRRTDCNSPTITSTSRLNVNGRRPDCPPPDQSTSQYDVPVTV